MHNLTGSELRFPENFLKYLHLYWQTTPNATAGYIYVYYHMDMYVHMWTHATTVTKKGRLMALEGKQGTHGRDKKEEMEMNGGNCGIIF